MTCIRCHNRTYCSRPCQEADWEIHKDDCGTSILDTMSPQEQAFLSTLVPATFLHSETEGNVFYYLVSCHRMRMADSFVNRPLENLDRSFKDATDVDEVEEFLLFAEKRVGILPAWWSEKKRRECLSTVGTEDYEFPNDYDQVEQNIVRCSKNYLMPMKLRLLGERIYGTRAPVSY